jgi:YggT family protein
MIILQAASVLLLLYQFLIFAHILLSWVPNVDRNSPLIRFVYDMTEPVLQPIRNALPSTGPIDFSPMIVLIIIWVLRMFLPGI